MMRVKKLLISFLILSLILPAASMTNSPTVGAADLSQFSAGRIIDDQIFTNNSSLSAADIQNFFIQHNSVCLKDFRSLSLHDDNKDGVVEDSTTEAYGPDTMSAAEIIKAAADIYRINPQVLIVTLQKEQGLITTTDCSAWKYNTALGYGCPDTAPCDEAAYGFTQQIDYGAYHLRGFFDDSLSSVPYGVGNNTIYFNPGPCDTWSSDGSTCTHYSGQYGNRPDITYCGSTLVNIQDHATAALYSYTPYQPNAAALAAGYGEAKPCGSYGNRNFFNYFTDWFGSTTVPQTNTYIPNGNYSIVNPVSGKVVDVSNASTADGARAWLYAKNGTSAQEWHLTREADGFYTMQNINSGKYLDVTNGSVNPGTAVQLWSGNAGCAQRWAIVAIDSSFQLINKCSGDALDITGGQMTNGTPLQIYTRNNSSAQLWQFTSADPPVTPDGLYKINTPTGLSLDVANAGTNNGTNVQIWNASPNDAQYWQIARLSSGFYSIRNPLSGRYLDATGEGKIDGTNVQIWDGHSTCAQEWSLVKNGDSTYTIISACSGLVLDVAGGAVSTSGANVQIWTGNGTPAQTWSLTPLDIIPSAAYSLSSPSGLVLDVKGASINDGAGIQLWSANRTSAQQWQIIKAGEDTYSIKNVNSNKYLDLAGANLAPGAGIQIWTGNGTCAQLWKITRNSNSSYSVHSACADLNVLDVTNGKIDTAGARVQSYPSNGSPAQAWYFGMP